MARAFGKAPVFIGTGGTIGPVSSFDRILNLPQVLIGVGLPDDAIHAPNEKFDLGQFFGGIETMATLPPHPPPPAADAGAPGGGGSPARAAN